MRCRSLEGFMQQQLSDLQQQACQAVREAGDLSALEAVRVQYLGKKSAISSFAQQLKNCSAQERPVIGQAINSAKQAIQKELQQQQQQLAAAALTAQLAAESLDVTLPGRQQSVGSVHPVHRMMRRAVQLLQSMGFSRHSGQEIEDVYHNFTALNIPEHHPASTMHDTFYLQNGDLLRTHTSPGQVRVMEEGKPPFRVMTPGKVYRRDSDHTHTPMFHQLEGFVVDKNCSFAQLKALLHTFLNALFERELPLRFRPSYFPFTEPSAEVDVQCVFCAGSGCRVCSQTGWLEVLGCGMIHPNVLQNSSINPDEYNGYAFGLGLDRLAMLHYDIPDLRLLFENDVRFLAQF